MDGEEHKDLNEEWPRYEPGEAVQFLGWEISRMGDAIHAAHKIDNWFANKAVCLKLMEQIFLEYQGKDLYTNGLCILENIPSLKDPLQGELDQLVRVENLKEAQEQLEK